MDRQTDFQVKQIFAEIEGSRLDAVITPESSMRRILKVLGSSNEVQELVRLLRTEQITPEDVLSRMSRLAGTTVDFRYRNPRDIALAAYLYAIIIAAPKHIYVACRIVLTAPNTWLANQIIGIVLSEWTKTYSSTTQMYPPASTGAWTTYKPSHGQVDDEDFVREFVQIAPFQAQKMYPAMNEAIGLGEVNKMRSSLYQAGNLMDVSTHYVGACGKD